MSQISFTPPILPAQVQTREDLGAPKASNEHEPLGLTDKYINKGERNVHIWNHPLTTLLQCKRNQIYLVGGKCSATEVLADLEGFNFTDTVTCLTAE